MVIIYRTVAYFKERLDCCFSFFIVRNRIRFNQVKNKSYFFISALETLPFPFDLYLFRYAAQLVFMTPFYLLNVPIWNIM